MLNAVKKAVIPAAGLGTRFLPVTKTIPKEMLPIVDTPILLHIVQEAVAAGIEDIVIISGRGKTAIEDFFDSSYELEDTLQKTGKLALLEPIKKIKEMANIISVRQKQALGLGHAVWTAKPVVGKEPFAVMLGDELLIPTPGTKSGLSHLCKTAIDMKMSTVAVMEVEASEVHKYGIVDVEVQRENLWKILSVVEKPKAEDAPSRLALPGRYVFESDILEILETTKPSPNGEIYLTDAMTTLAKKKGLLATILPGRRFDAGDKMGYLQANIELGLEHPEIGPKLREYLRQLAGKL